MGFVFNPIRPPHDCDDGDPRIDECVDEMLLQKMFSNYEEKEYVNETEERKDCV